ncbi:MAG: uncharacterized protein KVP18_000669 [Porospora cf. gigantea A]|uniref:uncharacterized protein n=1 Tax=Porospora cf. gigantea A TaxID=2853593 RepID=UPI00355A965F|nr:MAG: hypothetical protein KVP18_000669 [Porospora cf. gigantea A]
MRIEHEIKLDFKDVLIRPKRSTLASRSEVNLDRTYTFRHSGKTWTGVPIIASNMDSTGTFEVAKALASFKMLTVLHKHYTVDEIKAFADANPETLPYVIVSCGSREGDLEKVQEIFRLVPAFDFICIDVANGYHEKFVGAVERLRAAFPNKTIFAGNVVTNDMTEELILSGADIVKVGIGPGSVCTTRKMTGVGYPQLSAIIECADAAHGLKGMVIADGGCACSGDVSKAFAAGADFVMLGGMLAGHDECGGELVTLESGQKLKMFYGMSSDTAMKKYAGGVAGYRSSEGKTVTIPYRGPIKGSILDILGGVRSSCTYVGAESLKELSKRTTFIRVSQQLNPVFSSREVATENRGNENTTAQ